MPQEQKSSTISNLRRLGFTLLLLLLLPAALRADSLEDAARQLAHKIATGLPRKEIVIADVRDLRSTPGEEKARIQRALQEALKEQGISETTTPDITLSVYVSETITEWLLIAKVRQGELDRIEIVSLARRKRLSGEWQANGLTLKKELLWEQPEMMLDAALVPKPDAGPLLLVLEPGRVVLYERGNDPPRIVGGAPLPAIKPWPRDLRGQILASDKRFEIRLPGIRCRAQVQEKLLLDCSEKADPDGLAPGRNFYPARQSSPGERKGRPYFSVAGARDESSYLELVRGTDGRTYVFRGEGSSVVATIDGWGSEIENVNTPCGTKRQVLVSRPGDWTVPDSLQAFEIHDDHAIPVSAPLEFPGPITALSMTGEHDAGSVTAIVRNLQTGNYEAYRVLAACNR